MYTAVDEKSAFRSYLIDATQSGAIPLTYESWLEMRLRNANEELDRLRQGNTCAHAGDCKGCSVMQTQCLAYHHYLFKKYEKIALENSLELDRLREEMNSYPP